MATRPASAQAHQGTATPVRSREPDAVNQPKTASRPTSMALYDSSATYAEPAPAGRPSPRPMYAENAPALRTWRLIAVKPAAKTISSSPARR